MVNALFTAFPVVRLAARWGQTVRHFQLFPFVRQSTAIFRQAAPSLLAFGLVLAAGCLAPNRRSAPARGATGDEAAVRSLPSAVAQNVNDVTGVAYDPGTDLLYLRLAPGNRVRVVDLSTARTVREFALNELPATGGGGLALRLRDHHLFIARSDLPVVVETTATGFYVRSFTLTGTHAPMAGLAWDQQRELLLTLQGGDLSYVSFFDSDGHRLRGVSLDRNVQLGALAYDAATQDFYVPLAGTGAVGVFNPNGELIREIPSRPIPP